MDQGQIREFLEVIAELTADLDEEGRALFEAKLLDALRYNPRLCAYPGNVWSGIIDMTVN